MDDKLENKDINRLALSIDDTISLDGEIGKKRVLESDFIEKWLIGVTLVMGFFFLKWVIFTWMGIGVTLFATIYVGVNIWYMASKGKTISREGQFWFTMILLIGFSYSFFQSRALEPIRSLLLFLSAVYAPYISQENGIGHGTSNWSLVDGFNALVIIPFTNMDALMKILFQRSQRSSKKNSNFIASALGIVFILLLSMVIFPLLLRADSGGFIKVALFFDRWKTVFNDQFLENIIIFVLSLPVSIYLFGLFYGNSHKRHTSIISLKGMQNTIEELRFINPMTVRIVLTGLLLIYGIFIVFQLPYLISLLSGQIPKGWSTYADFARNGFFELCQITFINLVVLTVLNGMQAMTNGFKTNKSFNIGLSLLTLMLIALAFTKMLLYISVYGLTDRRILPCVFMVILALIFTGIIVSHFKRFSIVRLGLFTSVILMTLLIFINTDSLIVNYNASRYLGGSLDDFDTEVLYRAGYSGVGAAIDVYHHTDDVSIKEQLKAYLDTMKIDMDMEYQFNKWHYEKYRANEMIQDFRP